MNETTLYVKEGEGGRRLDQWLTARHEGLSRTYFQRLLEEGLVLVNGDVGRKRYLVCVGDEIELQFRSIAPSHLLPQDLPLTVLYEDQHLLLLDKRPGMVVHPGAGCWEGTVANALAFRLASDPSNLRPGIVHRLDKETSGLLITAKTAQAHVKLVEAFAAREVGKHYLALCCKHLPPSRVELPIERDPHQRERMRAGYAGRSASTLFYLESSSPGSDRQLHLLRAELLTGRTHQIRVHLKASGCPLLGDRTYGWLDWNEHYGAPRQMLHAWKLSLRHPITSEMMHWTAPIPEDFMQQCSRAAISCERILG